MKYFVTATLISLLLSTACSSGKSSNSTINNSDPKPAESSFNADSAYTFIEKQLSFGPRVPGSAGHTACGDWLEAKLRSYKPDTIYIQTPTLFAYNGDALPIKNIIASYNKDKAKRVLLVAHWDTRPWADNDPDPDDKLLPIPGANDGGSGVAVLLEIARNLAKEQPDTGIDLFFTDAEDYGRAGTFDDDDDSWCLGTQYFINNLPYQNNIKPEYAIVLDMVGGKNASFKREWVSQSYAKKYVDRIWSTAKRLGYSSRFPDQSGVGIIDDHVFLNKAGIPTVDIVEAEHPATNGFPPEWHTHDDNINAIDRSTLQAVGSTVLATITAKN